MAPPPLSLGSLPALLGKPLPDELIVEILLRLPPDDPACLLRSSLVCKLWRTLILHRSFCDKLHQLHKRPPILALLQKSRCIGDELFISTVSTFYLAVPRCCWPDTQTLDCRHGRALLLCGSDLIVWDTITDDQQCVPVRNGILRSGTHLTAAVICTADGCNHRGCRGGPFRIVCVFQDGITWVWSVYSSNTNRWGKPKSIDNLRMFIREHRTSILVGKSLLYFLSDEGKILEYDLAGDSMARITSTFQGSSPFEGKVGIHLILREDGGLGAAEWSSLHSRIQLWSGSVSDHSNALWVKSRAIHLEDLFSGAGLASTLPKIMGFVEGANSILFSIADGVFTVDLETKRIRKLCKYAPQPNLWSGPSSNHFVQRTFVPISTFYIPRFTKQEEARQLFRKGYKAIQKGNFANAVDFLSHAIEIRSTASGMLASVGELVKKIPGNIVEEVKILCDVAKIFLKREDVESSLWFFLQASLAILKHLVESDDRRNVELTFCICSVLVVAPKIRDAISAGSYIFSSQMKREELIGLCRSYIQDLKNGKGADKGDNASATEGETEKTTLPLAGRLAEVKKKVEELEQALSSLIPASESLQLFGGLDLSEELESDSEI